MTRHLFAIAAGVLALSLPLAAQAYVGPGAGLSLLGALWALLIVLGTALLFIVAWPLRKMLRRRRAERAGTVAEDDVVHHEPARAEALDASRRS